MDFTQTQKDLLNFLRLGKGRFTLGFAVINAPLERQALIQDLQEKAATQAIKIQVLSLSEAPLPNLYEALCHAGQHADTLFVVGLEKTYSSKTASQAPLAKLNFYRERLRRALPQTNLVFWLPLYMMEDVALDAPDLWAWRSATFIFELPDLSLEGLWAKVESEPQGMAYDNLNKSQKQNKIQELKALLAEYEHREDAKQSLEIQGNLAYRIGWLLDRIGQYDEALTFYAQSLNICQQVGDRKGEGTTLNNISQIYDAKGEYDTALQYLKQSLAIRQQIGDQAGEGATLNNIGTIFFEQRNELEKALTYFVQAQQILESLGSPKAKNPKTYLKEIKKQLGEARFNKIMAKRPL